jgi:hypothetical protein
MFLSRRQFVPTLKQGRVAGFAASRGDRAGDAFEDFALA